MIVGRKEDSPVLDLLVLASRFRVWRSVMPSDCWEEEVSPVLYMLV